MEKKLIVEFKSGKKYEIDVVGLANRIADIDSIDNHSDRVADLLNDEFMLFEAVWNMEWEDICPEANDKSTAKEWKRGDGKISING